MCRKNKSLCCSIVWWISSSFHFSNFLWELPSFVKHFVVWVTVSYEMEQKRWDGDRRALFSRPFSPGSRCRQVHRKRCIHQWLLWFAAQTASYWRFIKRKVWGGEYHWRRRRSDKEGLTQFAASSLECSVSHAALRFICREQRREHETSSTRAPEIR